MFDASRPAELQQTLAALCALEGLGRFVLYVSQVSSLATPRAIPVAKQLPSSSKWSVQVCRHPMQAGGNDAVRAVVSNAARRLQQRARKFERWMYKPARRHQQVVVVCAHYPGQTVSMACTCQKDMLNHTCNSSCALTQASRSQHYKYGLYRAFQNRRHSHVIVLDDDMQVSPDFLLYFEVRWLCKGHLPSCNHIDRSVA
jgi:GNT-I family